MLCRQKSTTQADLAPSTPSKQVFNEGSRYFKVGDDFFIELIGARPGEVTLTVRHFPPEGEKVEQRR